MMSLIRQSVLIVLMLCGSGSVLAASSSTFCATPAQTIRPDLSQIMASNTPETSILIFQSMLRQASKYRDKTALIELLAALAHSYSLTGDNEKSRFYLDQAEPFLSDTPDTRKINVSLAETLQNATNMSPDSH
ncbi:hypothetical protein [Photobacterium sp. TLY01]|uniref:hypothetical protein n=1 Tax=Photobacterium sp. TLY01 TaxID=2907534 RepID=UPI001F42B49E|nr:hypothetical protein [Photobacterium sp. TLY01]UIP26646.1 hypothetical protein LN341_08250 [Photobacterium sp. TLY01]